MLSSVPSSIHPVALHYCILPASPYSHPTIAHFSLFNLTRTVVARHSKHLYHYSLQPERLRVELE